MMTPEQREAALTRMRQVANTFYADAARIGNHPFIEFAGLMNEYILCCQRAHAQGVDFSDCNQHSGHVLPMHSTSADYINEKLACIFSGGKILDAAANEAAYSA